MIPTLKKFYPPDYKEIALKDNIQKHLFKFKEANPIQIHNKIDLSLLKNSNKTEPYSPEFLMQNSSNLTRPSHDMNALSYNGILNPNTIIGLPHPNFRNYLSLYEMDDISKRIDKNSLFVKNPLSSENNLQIVVDKDQLKYLNITIKGLYNYYFQNLKPKKFDYIECQQIFISGNKQIFFDIFRQFSLLFKKLKPLVHNLDMRYVYQLQMVWKEFLQFYIFYHLYYSARENNPLQNPYLFDQHYKNFSNLQNLVINSQDVTGTFYVRGFDYYDPNKLNEYFIAQRSG